MDYNPFVQWWVAFCLLLATLFGRARWSYRRTNRAAWWTTRWHAKRWNLRYEFGFGYYLTFDGEDCFFPGVKLLVTAIWRQTPQSETRAPPARCIQSV